MTVPKLSSRRVLSLLAFAAFAVATASSAELTTTGTVRSVDNLPPAPATAIRALNTGIEVLVTWGLSTDDVNRFTPFGDAFVRTGGVRGYRVYRQAQGGAEELIGTTAPGVAQLKDPGVQSGMTYVYSVRPFDADNETSPTIVPGSADDLARIVSLGGTPPEVVVVRKVKAKMTFDLALDLGNQTAVDAFRTAFIERLASLLGISVSRIKITAITQGSTVVEFEIADVEGTTGEPAAAEALTELIDVAENDPAQFESIGPVLDVADESSDQVVVIPQPVDPDGVVVLGWFSRSGNQVGFEDFFRFADHFGLSDTSPSFDPLYDIFPTDAPDGIVDFGDFFRFADDFGKIIANAAEIQGLIDL